MNEQTKYLVPIDEVTRIITTQNSGWLKNNHIYLVSSTI